VWSSSTWRWSGLHPLRKSGATESCLFQIPEPAALLLIHLGYEVVVEYPVSPFIRPISAHFAGGCSFRTSERILVSRLTKRSSKRRGEPSGRARLYISTTCCAVNKESRTLWNPVVDKDDVRGGGGACRGCERARSELDPDSSHLGRYTPRRAGSRRLYLGLRWR